MDVLASCDKVETSVRGRWIWLFLSVTSDRGVWWLSGSGPGAMWLLCGHHCVCLPWPPSGLLLTRSLTPACRNHGSKDERDVHRIRRRSHQVLPPQPRFYPLLCPPLAALALRPFIHPTALDVWSVEADRGAPHVMIVGVFLSFSLILPIVIPERGRPTLPCSLTVVAHLQSACFSLTRCLSIPL